MAISSNDIQEVLEKIYPVGAVYINTVDYNPFQLLGFGKWVRIAKNEALWGARQDGDSGTEREAGIPNIIGSAGTWNQWSGTRFGNGAFSSYQHESAKGFGSSGTDGRTAFKFKASDGETKLDGTLKGPEDSKVYGNSDTVQPPAYLVNIWERIE